MEAIPFKFVYIYVGNRFPSLWIRFHTCNFFYFFCDWEWNYINYRWKEKW